MLGLDLVGCKKSRTRCDLYWDCSYPINSGCTWCRDHPLWWWILMWLHFIHSFHGCGSEWSFLHAFLAFTWWPNISFILWKDVYIMIFTFTLRWTFMIGYNFIFHGKACNLHFLKTWKNNFSPFKRKVIDIILWKRGFFRKPFGFLFMFLYFHWKKNSYFCWTLIPWSLLSLLETWFMMQNALAFILHELHYHT